MYGSVTKYTGLKRDDHRALKVYAAAADVTIKSIVAAAIERELAIRPGFDHVKPLIEHVRSAIDTDVERKQLS